MEQSKPGSRGPQVLRLLYQHGPLSLKTLQKLIAPPIQTRKLQLVTKKLRDNGLVHRRYDSLPRNAGQVIDLSQTELAITVLSEILAVPVEQLKRNCFKSQELLHLDACAQWANLLMNCFPKADVVQDFNFDRTEWIKKIIFATGTDKDLRPDIVLRLRNSQRHLVHIAFEIERTRKSDKRLRSRLLKMIKQTKFDGIVYVCENPEIGRAVQKIFVSKALPRAHAIKHYGSDFLLVKNSLLPQSLADVEFLNVNSNPTSLINWVNFLVTTPPPERGQISSRYGSQLRPT